jgi:Cu2+-exporting ATPase
LVALGAGALTFAGWLAVGAEPAYAVERLVTVLVIACPHALGLAVPLVISISTTLGARNGLLVRDRRGLEEARLLKAVVFDKTGTLTLGEHRVVAVGVSSEFRRPKHCGSPQASTRTQSIRSPRRSSQVPPSGGLTVPRVAASEAIPGHGVQAYLDRCRLAVGGPNLVRRNQVKVSAEIEAFAAADRRAQSVVYLTENGRALAAFAVADAVRRECAEAVCRLHAQQVKVVMLTGDARAVSGGGGSGARDRYRLCSGPAPRRKSPRSVICKNRACASRWWGTE